MSKSFNNNTRRAVALVVVAGVAASVSWLINDLLCSFFECIEDEASWRADALIGDVVFMAYVVLTLVAVFLPALALRRHFGTHLASAIPTLVVASAISASLVNPETDGVAGIIGLFVFLAGPWLLANLAGLMVWPAREAQQDNVDIDCFS